MSYRPNLDDPETWKTLEQVRKELIANDPGKWFHSRVLEDIEVAIATGHASNFWELPDNTQALLIARFRVKGVRDGYEAMLAEQAAKRHRPKNQGRGAR